jgi:hypothetical protein
MDAVIDWRDSVCEDLCKGAKSYGETSCYESPSEKLAVMSEIMTFFTPVLDAFMCRKFDK